jgi:hypothetical protein
VGIAIQDVEADGVGQREIAAAHPHHRGEVSRRCRGRRRARQPASARSSRPNTPAAACSSVPRHSSTRQTWLSPAPLQPDRRVAAGEIVRAISVDFLGRKNRRLLQIGAAKFRDRFLDTCGRVRSARRRRGSRATISPPRSSVVVVTPSSMSLRTLCQQTTETAQAGGFADDQRQHARRERIERAGMPDLWLAGCPPDAAMRE